MVFARFSLSTSFVLIFLSFTGSSLLLLGRSVSFTFWCARSFATKEGRNISARSLLIYLTSTTTSEEEERSLSEEEEEGEGRWTNQPTKPSKNRPSAGVRAPGGRPNHHHWTKVSCTQPSRYLNNPTPMQRAKYKPEDDVKPPNL